MKREEKRKEKQEMSNLKKKADLKQKKIYKIHNSNVL
jgi:hypothetical protein